MGWMLQHRAVTHHAAQEHVKRVDRLMAMALESVDGAVTSDVKVESKPAGRAFLDRYGAVVEECYLEGTHSACRKAWRLIREYLEELDDDEKGQPFWSTAAVREMTKDFADDFIRWLRGTLNVGGLAANKYCDYVDGIMAMELAASATNGTVELMDVDDKKDGRALVERFKEGLEKRVQEEESSVKVGYQHFTDYINNDE